MICWEKKISFGGYMHITHGETNLEKMLANLQPILSVESYVYCFLDYPHLPDLPVWACMCEQEGRTLIMRQEEADLQGFSYEGVWRLITMRVHPSLYAVGLTAQVSTILSDAGIRANIVAGYYHDHVFVPAGSAMAACDLLSQLAGGKEPRITGK